MREKDGKILGNCFSTELEGRKIISDNCSMAIACLFATNERREIIFFAEEMVEMAEILEAASETDLRNRRIGRTEQIPGLRQAPFAQRIHDGVSGRAAEEQTQPRLADAGFVCEQIEVEFAVEMVVNPLLKILHDIFPGIFLKTLFASA